VSNVIFLLEDLQFKEHFIFWGFYLFILEKELGCGSGGGKQWGRERDKQTPTLNAAPLAGPGATTLRS